MLLTRPGIEIRGRSRHVRVKHRTTDEIQPWAVAQLAGCAFDGLDGELDTLYRYCSLTHGAQPDALALLDARSEATRLAALIREFRADPVQPLAQQESPRMAAEK